VSAAVRAQLPPPPIVDINGLEPRAAMGLGDAYARTPDLFDAQAFAALLRRERDELPALAEDGERSLAERHAAATLLALLGDSRLSVLDPPMLDVPGARIAIGTPAEDVDAIASAWAHVGVRREWIEKEAPRHEVVVDAFRIGRYPVTNWEFRTFLEDTRAAWLPTSWAYGVYPAERANHPVHTVAPEAADAYARWLASRTRRTFRLPSEAEWEYAAAGPDGREYPWGDTFEARRANTADVGPLRSTPVGIHPGGRAACGALDMAGNVEEYTADAYAPYPCGVVVRDDLQRAQASYRMTRGGSFTRFGDLARCRRRHGAFSSDLYAIGFRLAETPCPERPEDHR
jgi:formylglycine-generating enzyme required for sulfatase activity